MGTEKNTRSLANKIYQTQSFLLFRIKYDTSIQIYRESYAIKCHVIKKNRNGEVIQDPTSYCHDSCPQKIEEERAKNEMKENMLTIGTNSIVIGIVLSNTSDDNVPYISRTYKHEYHQNKTKGFCRQCYHTRFDYIIQKRKVRIKYSIKKQKRKKINYVYVLRTKLSQKDDT